MTAAASRDQSGRPATLVVVTGSGTDVGKTWVCVALAGVLGRSGVTVTARKPVQSFDPGEDTPRDSDRLAAATGEDPRVVCPAPRCYPVALAPPMAAEFLGRAPFSIADLVEEVTRSWARPAAEVGLVECAGGVASPQACDGDSVALIDALGADLVVLVTGAGLGAINSVRLCRAALGAQRRILVHLNRFSTESDLHRRNHAWLGGRERCEVTTSIAQLADLVAGSARPNSRAGR